MDDLLQQLLAAETKVWEALLAGDPAADRAALADEFLSVTPTGFLNATDHAQALAAGPTVARYRICGAHAVPVGADHGLLTYRADYLMAGAGAEAAMYVSSLWRREADGWINVFSQDTPVSDTKLP